MARVLQDKVGLPTRKTGATLEDIDKIGQYLGVRIKIFGTNKQVMFELGEERTLLVNVEQKEKQIKQAGTKKGYRKKQEHKS